MSHLIIYFFLYCILGWIWETSYVSIKKRTFINRGFMYGPWLPIYGSGAMAILGMTEPFSDNLLLVFLVGMLGATILEYFTGHFMECIFHMRYWDYSQCLLNVNGYICLKASFAWGAFSVLLRRYIHPVMESLIMLLSQSLLEYISLFLMVVFVADMTLSVRAGLDLKEFMNKISDGKRLLEKADDYFHQIADNLYLDEAEEKLLKVRNAVKQKQEKISREGLLEKANTLLQNINCQLQEINHEQEHKRLPKLKQELLEFQEAIQRLKWELAEHRPKGMKRMEAILKKYPNAISKKHPEALEEFRNIHMNKKNRTEDTNKKADTDET